MQIEISGNHTYNEDCLLTWKKSRGSTQSGGPDDWNKSAELARPTRMHDATGCNFSVMLAAIRRNSRKGYGYFYSHLVSQFLCHD